MVLFDGFPKLLLHFGHVLMLFVQFSAVYQHHIFTLNIDGSGEKQITRVEAYHGEPEWIPGKD